MYEAKLLISFVGSEYVLSENQMCLLTAKDFVCKIFQPIVLFIFFLKKKGGKDFEVDSI